MPEIDGWLEGFMHGQASIALVLLVSFLIGLRHATDPDHLAAVTTLLAGGGPGEEPHRVRQAGLLGLSWGLGHGTTLVLVGLPLVLLGRHLPETVQQAAEAAIGGIIVLLAIRLLQRWRRGLFHVHAHSHDGQAHRHVHSHAEEKTGASHEHVHAGLRSPLSSYGVGLVHGVGGSGGLTLLLLSALPNGTGAAGALLLFAVGTALSMALLSCGLGLVIASGPLARRFDRVAPILGVMSVAFGTWYALGALGLVTYPL